MKVAMFTVCATAEQAVRWKRAAESEGHRSAGHGSRRRRMPISASALGRDNRSPWRGTLAPVRPG